MIDHEIFFKIYDGPQETFLRSTFLVLFFKLRRLEHKTSCQGDLRKTRHVE